MPRIGNQLPVEGNYNIPLYATSVADEAIALANIAGLVLDEWQQNVLRASLGYKKGLHGKKWSAGDVTLIVPRQNGKGSILEARELAGLYLLPEKLILHSAHEHKTAKEGFKRLSNLIQNTPQLAADTKFRSSGADTSIEVISDGSRCMFVARTNGATRGFTVDTVILDEAFNLTDDMLASQLPTVAAVPNAQIWYVSSTGMDDSEVLLRMSDAGQRGDEGMAYFEWKSDDDAETNDVDEWYRANPALGIRLDEDTVRKELRAMGDVEFKRERLGLWENNDIRSLISKELWATLRYTDRELESKEPGVSSPSGQVSFAVDVDPDSLRGSVYACGPDQYGLLSVVRVAHDDGTAWIPEFLSTRVAKWKPKSVALDAASPAGALIPKLNELGIAFTAMSSADCYSATANFLTHACNGRLRHRPDVLLDGAVESGIKRPVGNKGMWLWDRKQYTDDITALVAASYAVYAWEAFEDVQRSGVVW